MPSGAKDSSEQTVAFGAVSGWGWSLREPQGRQRRMVPVYLVALMEMGPVGSQSCNVNCFGPRAFRGIPCLVPLGLSVQGLEEAEAAG